MAGLRNTVNIAKALDRGVWILNHELRRIERLVIEGMVPLSADNVDRAVKLTRAVAAVGPAYKKARAELEGRAVDNLTDEALAEEIHALEAGDDAESPE